MLETEPDGDAGSAPPPVPLDVLARRAGGPSLSRGVAYASQGRVQGRTWDPGARSLSAHVRGSGVASYSVRVRFGDDGSVLTALCSCPVGSWCKHVVAVLVARAVPVAASAPADPVGAEGLAAPDPVPAAPPGEDDARDEVPRTWALVLDGVLRPDGRPQRSARPVYRAPVPTSALGLVVETQDDPGGQHLDPPRSRRLAARPVLRSGTGRWVRTGATWREVLHAYGVASAPPGQREALAALHRVVDTEGSGLWGGFAGGGAAQWVSLDRAPTGLLWAALDELRRAGVPLLESGKPFREVVVLPAPLRAAVDLSDRGGDLALRPAVLDVPAGLGDPLAESARAGLLGGRSAGGLHWEAPDGRTVLARLAQPLDARGQAMLTMPGALRIPADTRARFWSGYAATLRTLVELTSDDGTVAVPAPARPVLRLRVAPADGLGVRTGWTWVYRTPPAADETDHEGARGPEGDRGDVPSAEAFPPVPVGPVDPVGQPWRRPADEAPVLAAAAAAVRAALVGLPDGTGDEGGRLAAALLAPLEGEGPGGEGSGVGRSGGADAELGAWSAAALVAHVLPALAGVHGVEVDGAGELPRFREASGPVEVLVGQTGDEPAEEATPEGEGEGAGRGEGDGDPGRAGAGGGEAPNLGGDRDWFDLSVTLRVDGRDLPLARVLTAMAAGDGRVMLDDGLWARIDTPALEALRTLVAEARALADPRGRPGQVRVSRYDTSAWDELEALGVVVEQARAWRAAVEHLSALAAPELEDAEPPAEVLATLRPYQRSGFAWLRRLVAGGLGGVLADDMGLGKTLQVLSLVAWFRGPDGPPAGRTGPVLVVAPTSVVGTWAQEAARFTPHLVVRTVDATAARRGVPLAEVAAGADLVVTSYALFRLEADEHHALPWSALVLDEAQTLKNHTSRGYAAARTLAAPVKIAITGTPLENSVLELWALLGLVAPGLLPGLQRFTEHYRRPIEREGDTARLADLRRRIRPFVLRRTKEEVAADLPPRLEHVVEVDLAPAHRAVYETHLARERQKVLGLLEDWEGNRFAIFRSLTLLRRLALDPSLVDEAHAHVPASKLDHLQAMLAEIVADGHRVLVFSQFTSVLGRVRARLDAAGTSYAYLDGGTRARPAVVESFRSGEAPVFLISLKAGGVGLTLTEADYVVVLDPWWNPAVEAQAVDRAHRIGQTRQVMVYRLVAAGTIEDKVMALKAAKSQLFDSVLGGGDLADARLSAADVRDLLA
ncbi:SNF2-related protein [Cellulomonas endophytica]|uniref:SNF2-related protein n=1 Tax=Cellulomonas endophytica TaxID=2494735 RepID=UPI001011ECF2|nr:DEAD/DEAH box helicase [Cellulomonas endophytica]